MNVVKSEVCCLENRQSTAASSSSVSEGSGSASLKSPGIYSPARASPSYRRTTGPIRRAKGGWTPQEDETLRTAVSVYKGKSWKRIAEFFSGRSEVQCLHRWQKVLNPDLVKGPWAQEEDDKITELVGRYGPTKWSAIAKSLPGRIGKQCRERSIPPPKSPHRTELVERNRVNRRTNKRGRQTTQIFLVHAPFTCPTRVMNTPYASPVTLMVLLFFDLEVPCFVVMTYASSRLIFVFFVLS